jgi:hypothetical protein
MDIADFPRLLAAAEQRGKTYPRRFAEAVDWLAEGQAAGKIRNARLTDAKFIMGSLIYEAWREERRQHGLFESDEQHPAVRKIFESLHLSGLNDIMVASRKLEKAKVTSPEIERLRSFVSEVLPLAKAADLLKDKDRRLMGKEPPSQPKPENPNKIVRQCPCCYRGIAVTPKGTMAHHGYERPGGGYQTDSCMGIGYRPLDISTEGLEVKLQFEKAALSYAVKFRSSLDTPETVVIPWGMGSQTFEPGSPRWDWALNTARSQADHEVSELRAQIGVDLHVLRNWVAGRIQPVPSRYDLGADAGIPAEPDDVSRPPAP